MATISTNIHNFRKDYFFEVEVAFEDLQEAYNEEGELNITQEVSGGHPFISRFSPSICLMHSFTDPYADADLEEIPLEEPRENFVLTFKNTAYLKCRLHKFNIELLRISENYYHGDGMFRISESSLATNVKTNNDSLKLAFDINNDMLAHPLKIKALKGLLSIHFEPDESFFLNQALEQEFSLLRLPKEPEDFRIKCQNEEVKFSKNFLCKISDVFAAMIENPNTVESRQGFVAIEGVDIEVVKSFKTILCEQKALEDHFDCKLLLFADRYNIQPLVRMCRSIIEEYISRENILEVIKTADKMNDHILLKAAGEYVSENKGSFDKDPEWTNMLQNNPQCFAKMMELVIFK